MKEVAMKEVSNWKIEQAYEQPGHEHMLRDENLARLLTKDPKRANVFRLYSWSPAALSLGFQQKMEVVDLARCRAENVDVVRRPTGGRGVYHVRELTYSVILRAPATAGIYAVHNQIVRALLESLSGLGPEYRKLELTTAQSTGSLREAYRQESHARHACFAATARHEATFQGRKVIGSAQRRFGDVVLQHGSILMDPEHLRLPHFLQLSEDERDAMYQHLKAETATLPEVFGRPLTIPEVANSLRSQFVEHICTLNEQLS